MRRSCVRRFCTASEHRRSAPSSTHPHHTISTAFNHRPPQTTTPLPAQVLSYGTSGDLDTNLNPEDTSLASLLGGAVPVGPGPHVESRAALSPLSDLRVDGPTTQPWELLWRWSGPCE